MRSRKQAPVTITTDQAAWYATYKPRPVKRTVEMWQAIQATHTDIMLSTTFKSLQNFKSRCTDVTKYLAWRHALGKDLAIQESMTIQAITEYHNHGPLTARDRHTGESLSRLKIVARQVNPLVILEEPPAFASKAPLQPPYTLLEETHIRRVSLRQRRPLSRKRLCLMVGMAGGAGIRPTEMRNVRDRHLELVNSRYIITIEGPYARKIPVHGPYNELIRVGLKDVRPGHKLLAPLTEHRSITGKIVDQAEIMGDVPRINAARLRNTWLTRMLSLPISMVHILTLAGIESPRNLVDLIPYTDVPPLDTDAAAGEEK